MKKLAMAVVVLVAITAILWQQRVNLLVALMPVIQEIRDPIPANQPINWDQGPAEALTPADERPPNIILVLLQGPGPS